MTKEYEFYPVLLDVLKTFYERKGVEFGEENICKIIKTTTKAGRKPFILVTATFRFCCNVEREHNSNNIYFIIGEDGKIYQKCHSESIGENNKVCSKTAVLIGQVGKSFLKLEKKKEEKQIKVLTPQEVFEEIIQKLENQPYKEVSDYITEKKDYLGDLYKNLRPHIGKNKKKFK